MRILTPFGLYFFLSLMSGSGLFGQDRKLVQAARVDSVIRIDGKLTERAWNQANEATAFVQQEPFNGRPSKFDTKVYTLYDDNALYVGAVITDPHPDSLSYELHERDNSGLADYFGLILDPFNDGLNGLGFVVTARGGQSDMKFNNWDDEEDLSWDAVWRSAVSINSDGWSVEMAIPYSALRFPNKDEQRWGINFFRSIQRYREYSSWNLVDVNKQGMVSQLGELLIGEPLQPPVRLSATPYLSASGSHNSRTDNWLFGYNYGMDLKVGLNESFTLDLTLIPDFGQVESDELVYSLSPFEVYYEEKRPFFTEGTELFNKGNVFYSRRIGAVPGKFQQVAQSYEPDQIVRNPETVQLINAAKISGKTAGGLGVGLFNAITANTFAEVEIDGKNERILTEPFANYNMLVLEQSLPYNSQLSFYNTNVVRPDASRMANVTGTEMSFRDQSGKREFYAMLNVSQDYDKQEKPVFGERLLLSLSKINGQFRPDTWFNLMTDHYDPNEMGYQKSNNEIGHGVNLRYNIYEPRDWRLRWFNRIYLNHYYQFKPLKFSMLEIGGESRVTTQKQLTIGGNFNFYPLGKLDFFEARTKGRYFQKPLSFNMGIFGSPDYRKTFLIDYRLGFRFFPEWELFNWWVSLTPRWRIADHFMLIPSLVYDHTANDIGFTTSLTEDNHQRIIFGERNLRNVTSSISLDYVFTPSSALAFRLRHYWLLVDYNRFFDLDDEGSLQTNGYNEQHDFSVSTFNIDMVYRWNFAPGSELLLVWKNAVYSLFSGDDVKTDYFGSLERTFDSPVGNSLSIKLLYYIDWQQIKSIRKN